MTSRTLPPSSHTGPHLRCPPRRNRDVDQWEANYEYLGILIQITGTRPPVTSEQVQAAIANQCHIPLDDRLQIHPAMPPYDFLLIAPNHGAYLSVLAGDRMIQTTTFTLSVRPW